MAAVQARIETALERCLPSREQAPQRLHEAMRYAVLGGGKRVRPLLAFAAGAATGASEERVETVACALELIHAYSLVHDDMPCMDNDVLRRGRPTVHVEFDEATALLVGDSLQAAAFELVAEAPAGSDHGVQLELVRLLARAAGSRGMAGGQAIDLESVGKSLTLPELEFMHILKTGALIRASVTLGALCGSPTPGALGRLDHYAKLIGLAFQVVDDTLDAAASTVTLGKTAGKDAVQRKPTYVTVLGLERARELAQELRREAHDAIAGFDERAKYLRGLADFIVLRRF